MEIEKALSNIAEIKSTYSISGDANDLGLIKPNIATINLYLDKPDYRQLTLEEVGAKVRKETNKIDGAVISVAENNSLMQDIVGSASDQIASVAINVLGGNLSVLEKYTPQVVDAIKSVEGTENVYSSLENKTVNISLKLDNKKVTSHGLAAPQIFTFIKSATDGTEVATAKNDADTLNIIVKYAADATESIDDILALKMLTPAGSYITLSDVASYEKITDYDSITRTDKQNSATITSNVVGKAQGTVTKEIKEKISALDLPSSVSIVYSGQEKMMNEAFSGLLFALIISIVIVYMVMAVQFQSLKNPFIIMFSLPLAFSGSIIALYLFKYSLNVASFIGIIMLVGIVVNNAIVMIDRITQMREEGVERKTAIIESSAERLRPILMTALTTIIALIPVAFATGEGSELMSSLAAVVAGGLISSTFLTLIIIPSVYEIFNRHGKHQR